MYLDHDIDSQKALGVPAYSYGWKNVKVAKGAKDGLFAPGTPIDIDKVNLNYKQIEKAYLNKTASYVITTTKRRPPTSMTATPSSVTRIKKP